MAGGAGKGCGLPDVWGLSMMSPDEIITAWGLSEKRKLMPKQVSIRLPVIVDEKISALCALYPLRTKSEVIGSLLAYALNQIDMDGV